jgi:hypothetical protein
VPAVNRHFFKSAIQLRITVGGVAFDSPISVPIKNRCPSDIPGGRRKAAAPKHNSVCSRAQVSRLWRSSFLHTVDSTTTLIEDAPAGAIVELTRKAARQRRQHIDCRDVPVQNAATVPYPPKNSRAGFSVRPYGTSVGPTELMENVTMKYGFRATLHSQEAAQLYYSKGGFSI